MFDFAKEVAFSSYVFPNGAVRNISVYVPLKILDRDWRLVSAKAKMHTTPATATLNAALYSYSSVGKLRVVAGSTVTISFDGDRLVHKARLNQEVLLTAGEQYYAGVHYTSAADRVWSSMNIGYGILSCVHRTVGVTLATEVDLRTVTLYNEAAPVTDEQFIPNVIFLTPEGDRLY